MFRKEITNALGQRTVTESNVLGLPVKMTYPDNSYITKNYSLEGFNLSEAHSSGTKMLYSYNQGGQLLTQRLLVGEDSINKTYKETAYTYNIDGKALTSKVAKVDVRKTTKAETKGVILQSITNSYDQAGRLTKTISTGGGEKRFEYDKVGNLITTKEKIDSKDWKVTRFEYNLQSQSLKKIILVDTVDVPSNILRSSTFDNEYPTKIKAIETYAYDATGKLISTTDPLGNTATFEYDLNGQVVKRRDQAGNATTYIYDVKGQLKEEINLIGAKITYTYNNMGQVATKTVPYKDSESAVYTYEYDLLGNLTKQIEPDQGTKGTSSVYDNMNRVIETRSPEGDLLSKITYDTKGQVVKQVDGLRIREDLGTTFTYDNQGNVLTTTDPLGNTTTFTYDLLGQVLTVTDAKDQTTTYNYNEDSTLSQVTYPDDSTESFSYDLLGRAIEKVDQLGNGITYTYNAFDTVREEKAPLGSTIKTKINLKGEVVSLTDQLGDKTYFYYDARGKLVKKETPAGREGSKTIYRVESYVYDELGRIVNKTTKEKDSNKDIRALQYAYYNDNKLKEEIYSHGEKIIYSYDKRGNLATKKIQLPDGKEQIREYTYDSSNRVLTDTLHVDEEGLDSGNIPNLSSLASEKYGGKYKLTETYTYDILGNVQSKTNSRMTSSYSYDKMNRLVGTSFNVEGTTYSTRMTYDSLGNKLTETSPKGQTVTYTYDALNRILTTTDTAGNTYSNTYDAKGQLLTVTNPKGQSQSYTYDALGRVTIIKDAYDIIITRNTYDAKSNLLTRTDANGSTTSYIYDQEGRVTKVTDPEAGENTTVYNIYGEVIKKINAEDETTVYSYDNRGLLTEVKDPIGVITYYSYDDRGNKVKRIDGQGRQTKYTYNADNRLLTVTNPEGKKTTYNYNLEGDLLKETKHNSHIIKYTYDQLGRQKSKENLTTRDKIQYSYDILGNRTEMVDGTGTTTYSYDNLNRLITKEKDGEEEIVYTYDALGNMLSMSTKGNTVTYTYDKSNRMSIVSYDGNETTYAYDQAGNRKSLTYPNGVKITYDYDKNNRVTSIKNKKGLATLSSLAYTYDQTGRVIRKENHLGITNYTYDQAGRLKKEEAPGYTTRWTYDLVGNRVSQVTNYNNEQSTSFVNTDTNQVAKYVLKRSYYIYNNADQLLRTTEKMYDTNNLEILQKTTNFVYDEVGNQTSQVSNYSHPHNINKKQKVQAESYKETTESFNSLIDRVKYTYDGFDRLGSTEKVSDGKRTIVTYLYNGDGLRTKKTVKASDRAYVSEVTNYTYDRQHVVIEVDASSKETFYLRGLNYLSKTVDNKQSYYLYNGHGDVIQMVDESGKIQNQYVYDAFGNEVFNHEEVVNAIRYSGEFFDVSTGLYYLRARYYNPYIGRFISEDSYWGEDTNPASLNLYTYTHNDPVNFIDPSGHKRSKKDRNKINKRINTIDRAKQKWAELEAAMETADSDESRAILKDLQEKYHQRAEKARGELGDLDGDNESIQKLIDQHGDDAGDWEEYKRDTIKEEIVEKISNGEDVTQAEYQRLLNTSISSEVARRTGKNVTESNRTELIGEYIDIKSNYSENNKTNSLLEFAKSTYKSLKGGITSGFRSPWAQYRKNISEGNPTLYGHRPREEYFLMMTLGEIPEDMSFDTFIGYIGDTWLLEQEMEREFNALSRDEKFDEISKRFAETDDRIERAVLVHNAFPLVWSRRYENARDFYASAMSLDPKISYEDASLAFDMSAFYVIDKGAEGFVRSTKKLFLSGNNTKISIANNNTVQAKNRMNLSAGDNILDDAINVDIKDLPGIDVVADANSLPFEAGYFDEVVIQNPYGYQILESDVARVMNSGAELKVVGAQKNKYFKTLYNATDETLSSYGYELVRKGPASEELMFGIQKTTDGIEFSEKVLEKQLEIILRRK